MDCQWAFFVHKNYRVFDTNPNVKPCPRNRLDNVLLIAPGLTLGFVHNKKGPRTMTDHTIKPIETQFKGYRFRSRLEARWAVFFDALGIQWEYEKEGYDLGELGWYLPDFWLPEFNQWVEVKPPTTETAKSVYLAGSFKNDWRFQFVRNLYIRNDMDSPVVIGNSNMGKSCTGPIWVDLSSGHGGTGHIVFDFGEDKNAKHRQIVHDRCLSQIEKADIFFAWIDTMDCYGTLAEIGYAKAKGKTTKL